LCLCLLINLVLENAREGFILGSAITRLCQLSVGFRFVFTFSSSPLI
jgi:hypothetical protein